jgi:4-carboxymuconolactone decarboxylase
MDSAKYETGRSIRSAVLGEAYVARSERTVDEFNRPIQEMVTEFCWGSVWSRPGLELKTRSLINVAMLSALGRQHELRLHLNGAINNGCSQEEVREVLIQVAAYCGFPASLEAFRTASDVFAAAAERKHATSGADAAG